MRRDPSPWPRRLALSTWLCALPLVVLGGTVTTLREGMVIEGWITGLDGEHFLLAYPVEKWFSDAGHFSEHTHRLFGTLVGLLSIALVAAAHLARASRAQIAWAWTALVAVGLQGAIGGFRVLENSPDLAFLHGAIAQVVLALLAVNVVLASTAWREQRAVPSGSARSLRRTSHVAVAAVYAQIVLGAWLRHTGSELALVLHLAFAVLATGAVVALVRGLRESGRPELARQGRRALGLVLVQLALGFAALLAIFLVSGGFTGAVSTAEAITATGHVLFGALLLQATVAAAMWIHRSFALEPAAASGAGLPRGVEGAR
jgi:cytochrome c oxidase assembly protein subunit 15